jgi:hypothetical protein
MSSDLLARTLHQMGVAVSELAKLVPAPVRVKFLDSFVYRHVERSPQQAIVQKLTRLPSGLGAARLLMSKGYFQEQGTLQRVVDEIAEDIVFLAGPLIAGPDTPLHKEYLDAFFEEDFDFTTGKPTAQDRPMVRRKKIRAYVANANGANSNPSGHIEAARTLSKTYSGFVHAASPHIMDTFGGSPPQFHVHGMLGTDREREFQRDIYNYFYRATMSFAVAARALGSKEQFDLMFGLAREYESLMGIR